MTTRAWTWLAAGLLVATPAARQDQETGRTFRAGTDAVQVDVSVRDGRRAVTGLGPEDFVVIDNGVAQTVSDVRYGRLPIDITVLLDISRSVTGPLLDQLRRAVRQLTRDLDDDDRLRLLTFNMRVDRVVDFTSDVAAIEAAIQTVNAGGGTSIRDALSLALVSASAPDRRQLVVIFTDGADSSSVTSADRLIDVARHTNASITVVVPRRLRSVNATGVDRRHLRALESLSAETGGSVLTATNDLPDTFRRALDEFRSTYVLYYTPTGVERDGFHTLEVIVRGREGYELRARRSYFGR